MGLINAAVDTLRGQRDLGRKVDAAYPGLGLAARNKMITRMEGMSNFTRSYKRFSNGSYASDFKGRVRDARFGSFGPRTMASDIALLANEGRRVASANVHARQAINILCGLTIGTGFNMNWKATSKTAQKRLDKAVNDWFRTPQCDVRRKHDFYGITFKAFKMAKRDGECLIRIRPRKSSDGLAVPFALEVLSRDFFYDGMQPAIKQGNSYAAGIEFSPIGHPVAYWLYKSHPDDGLIDRTPVRVPVINESTGREQIIHMFDDDGDRIRGLPMACIIVNTIYEQHDLRLSLLSRKRAESKHVFFIKNKTDDDDLARPNFGELMPGTETDPTGAIYDAKTGELLSEQDIVDNTIDPNELVSWIQDQLVGEGNNVVLPSGYDVTSAGLSTASDYQPFMKDLLGTIATGFGMPYWLLTGDTADVNFTSGKAGLLPLKTTVLREQGEWILFCKWVWDNAFAFGGELNGLWRAQDISCDFIADPFPTFDDQKAIGAIILKLRHGMISPRRAVAELGEDFNVIMDECEEDYARMEKIGFDIIGALKAKSTLKSVSSNPKVT